MFALDSSISVGIVIELLGLMGHTYAKMQLLVIARQLAAEIDGSEDGMKFLQQMSVPKTKATV